ncbi:MAG: sugar ABC transporter substrate-binding protein [Dehalobacterium sp.]
MAKRSMTKKSSIIMLMLVLTLLVAIAVTGCGKSDSEEQPQGTDQPAQVDNVEISFVNWASAEEATKPKIEKVIAAFETDNPGVKVKSITIPFTEVQNQITVMITGNNTPDVAQVPGDLGVSFAAMGALEPVEGILSDDFKATVTQSYLNVGNVDDQKYLIPWGGGPNGLWYNKKLMAEVGLDPNSPPKTMEELTKAMETAHAKNSDIIGLQFDTTVRPFSTEFQWPFIKSFGPAPFEGDQVNVSQMTDYADWLRTIMVKGYTLPGKKLGEFRPLAAQNRVLFAFDAPFLKGTMQSLDANLTDEVFYETWGVTALPVGKDGISYTTAGSNHYTCVFKNSKNKEIAAKFAEYLANSEVGIKEYIVPMGFLPVTSSAVEKYPESFDNPITKAFLDEVNPTIIAPPYGAKYTQAASDLSAAMQEVITTDKPIAEILKAAQTKAEEAWLAK